MANSFQGFPKEMFTFLEQLANNNNREWFNANKTRYKSEVVAPVMEFIDAIRPGLSDISPYYVADSRPHGGSMFRIYKDTRFSRDKRPYKEHVGCQFRHSAGKDAHAPGFYVHLSPNEVFFGAGIWRPPNPILDKVRTAIVEKPTKWATVINDKAIQKHFGGITGDGLKRPPRGYPADHPYIEDLKRKSFIAMHQADPQLVMTPRFIAEVEKSFSIASPLVAFVTNALELKF
jgi:uncharacterized protein (TIGR02453 family)